MRFVRLILMSLWLAVSLFAVTQAEAGFEADHVEISIPTSAWLVGPSMVTSSKAATSHIPCIMVNQFSSGESVRISGGGGKIYAIAIDFGERLFDKANYYPLDLSVGQSYHASVTAMAYDAETLLLGMQTEDGFYAALQNGKTLFINHGEDTLDLALVGVKEGLERMEHCYNNTSTNKSTRAAKPSVNENPSGFMPMPHTDMSAEEEIGTHQKQVEALVDDLMQVSENVTHSEGKREVAGSKPIKKGPIAVTGGKLASTWAMPEMPAPPKPAAARQPMQSTRASVPAGQVRTWRAIRGSSLREIIDVWARQENIRVVWMAGDTFTVKESMSVQGRFEDAILTMLNQYEKESPRPVGKIYRDPQFNQRVLLVESKADY